MSDFPAVLTVFSDAGLPEWHDLPDLDLYMDQILALLERYLSSYPSFDDKGITSSMINNYVKQKVMPAPAKKRYNRDHLAYLIMIYFLKSSLTMAQIQTLFEKELSKQSLEEYYGAFCSAFRGTASECAKQYKKKNAEVLSVSSGAAIRAYVEQSVSAAFLEGNAE